MMVKLMIPRPLAFPSIHKIVNSFVLRWTTDHSQSHYGQGVLLDVNGEIFDGYMYRHLQHSLGAWIETSDRSKVAGALGIPEDQL